MKNPTVEVECPFCKRKRHVSPYDIKRTGHKYCSGCAKRIKSNSYLIGTKVGRLYVIDFEEYDETKPVNYTAMKVRCDCGKEKTVLAQALKNGDTTSCGCYNREVTSALVGPKSAQYKPTLTDEDRKWRNSKQRTWSLGVRKRDKFCAVCGSNKRLIAHHLNSYADNEDIRFDLENGIALCRECHKDFHCNFMGGYQIACNEQDFELYLLQV